LEEDYEREPPNHLQRGELCSTAQSGEVPHPQGSCSCRFGRQQGVGKLIVERQRAKGWGSAVIERLSRDVRQEFPDIQGFSPRNIWRMRAFYLAYTEEVRNLPQITAEMPWMHNAVLIFCVDDATLLRMLQCSGC